MQGSSVHPNSTRNLPESPQKQSKDLTALKDTTGQCQQNGAHQIADQLRSSRRESTESSNLGIDIEGLRAAGVTFDFAAMAAGRCPVDEHTIAALQAEAGTTGKCPIDERTMEAIRRMQARHTGKTQNSNNPGKGQRGTGVDHELAVQGQDEVEAHASGPGGEPAKVVCPFGFGSVDAEGNSSNRTSLHCSKCKALYFEAVQTNCGHMFCHACIQPSPACLKCGATVEQLTPNFHVQGLVDLFVTEHTSDNFLEKRQSEDESRDEASKKDVVLLKAEFFLQIGLQSFRGGNTVAAINRLETCKDKLRDLSSSARHNVEVRTLMGSAAGCQGDCAVRLGDVQGAVQYYEASIRFLDGKDAEVQQALTVTQNKLGDLYYRSGNLRMAKDYYTQALEVRKQLCLASTTSESAEIDYALSLAKVADIEQACQELELADSHKALARSVTAKLLENPNAQGNRRLEGLAAYLDLQATAK